jgi:tetratricopeptide (TPR) repeat protein
MDDKINSEDEARKKEAKDWLKKAYSFERKKEHEKAIECFDNALEIEPKNAYSWDGKGWALYELGRYEEAIQCYNKAIEIKPKAPKFWNNKGVILDDLEKIDEALRCYEKAIEVRSNYSIAWCNKGDSLNRLGRQNEAIECFDRAIKIKQNNDYAWNMKGITLLELGRNDEAMDCFSKDIEINPKKTDGWLGKGWCLVSLGRYNESINCFDKVIVIDQNQDAAWDGKGWSLMGLNQHDQSIKCFDRAIEINPNNSDAWTGKGGTLYESDKHVEAISCFDKSIGISSEEPYTWDAKGRALYKLGRNEEALKCYDEAIKLEPKYADAWADKGEVLLDQEKFNESLDCYNKSIEINPMDAFSWEGKGKALRALGRTSEAEEAFAKARELKEKEPLDNGPKPAPLPEIIQDIQQVLERKGQVILYGPPGTGKTYWAERAAREIASLDRYEKSFDQLSEEQRSALIDGGHDSGPVRICCFHPAYGYEDFLEGYRPEETDGKMSFALRDGIFKKLCRDALANPDVKFYLIIDEINRGDIPRIFGELMTVLEKNKRGKPIILPVSGEQMRVPENVRVIGTMNTADRSIALLDTPLRRRFGFIEMMPDASVLGDSVVVGVHLGEWLSGLNRRICESVGRDARNRQIGHSYLMEEGKPISSLSGFSRVVQDEIIPLLEEYCYEDYSALEKILGGEVVDAQRQMIRHEIFEGSIDGEFVRAMLKISTNGASLCPSMTAGSEASEDGVSDSDEAPEEERTDG